MQLLQDIISLPTNTPTFVFFCFLLTFFHLFFVCSTNIATFAPSLVSSATGQRAVLYMRKTFSNVCRCEQRTSQTLNHNRQMTTETSAWCVSICLIIYSSCWRGLTALSILCGWAVRRPLAPGWTKKQTPTPFLYHK